MAYYQRRGSVPPKRHTQHRAPDGALLRGADGRGGLLLRLVVALPPCVSRRRSSTCARGCCPTSRPSESAAAAAAPSAARTVQGRRRRVDRRRDRPAAGARQRRRPDQLRRRRPSLAAVSQRDRRRVRLRRVRTRAVETIFGPLEARQGDYVLLPRATTHRWVPDPDSDEVLRLYCIEANSHITPARRYLSKFGQLLEHAPFCERDLHGPGELPEPITAEGDVEVYIKHRGDGPRASPGRCTSARTTPSTWSAGTAACTPTRSTSPTSSRSPAACTSRRRPTRSSRATTSSICNFVPRKVDYHPLSIPVPYYHSNVDSDEVMFYCGGNYEARKGSGIGQGSVSLHPGGHSHGPQPGAYERSIGAEFFDELAVMVDTFRPLRLGEGARASDDGRYAWTWSGRGPGRYVSAPRRPTVTGRVRARSPAVRRCPYRKSTSRCRQRSRSTPRFVDNRRRAVRRGHARRVSRRRPRHLAPGSRGRGRRAAGRPRAAARLAGHARARLTGRRLRRLLRLRAARDQRRADLPARRRRAHPRTGSTCLSATTAGRARSSCPARTSADRAGSSRPPRRDARVRPSRRSTSRPRSGSSSARRSAPGVPVPVDAFADHVFGVSLLNDWSARDIQGLETFRSARSSASRSRPRSRRGSRRWTRSTAPGARRRRATSAPRHLDDGDLPGARPRVDGRHQRHRGEPSAVRRCTGRPRSCSRT